MRHQYRDADDVVSAATKAVDMHINKERQHVNWHQPPNAVRCTYRNRQHCSL